MRAVVVSPSLPLPFGKTDARWLHVLVTELARRGAEVTCISSTEESDAAIVDARALAAASGYELVVAPLRITEGSIERDLHSLRRPFSEHARSPALRHAIERAARGGWDVLHVEHLYTSWATTGQPRVVVYVHPLESIDREGQTGLSLRDRLTGRQVRRAERMLIARAPRLIANSERVAKLLRAQRPDCAVPVVPQALDLAQYPVLPAAPAPVVGVIGSMYWVPSRTAARRVLTELWPRIRANVPDARLVVAGHGSREWLGGLFPIDGAELLGEVDHPADLFGRASVLLYPPPRGTGMKIKVMEAMAYGVPVITNAEGAEGLPTTNLTIAETDAALVDATIALLGDPARRRTLALGARDDLARSFTPAPVIDRLLDAYAQMGVG